MKYSENWQTYGKKVPDLTLQVHNFLFEKKRTGLLQSWSQDVWACQTLDTNENYSQAGNVQIFIYNKLYIHHQSREPLKPAHGKNRVTYLQPVV